MNYKVTIQTYALGAVINVSILLGIACAGTVLPDSKINTVSNPSWSVREKG